MKFWNFICRYNLDSELEAPIPFFSSNEFSDEVAFGAEELGSTVQPCIDQSGTAEISSSDGLCPSAQISPTACCKDRRDRNVMHKLVVTRHEVVTGETDQQNTVNSAECVRAFIAAETCSKGAHVFVVVSNPILA